MHIRPSTRDLHVRSRSEPVPLRLDDLCARLGPGLASIRAALESEDEIACVMADREGDGATCVLVATRSSVHVCCPATGATQRSPWAAVRVSPIRVARRDEGRLGCEITVEDVRFTVAGDGADGSAGIQAFHDEIVRRGTPWHYPRER
jgi:hypothetical protein